MTTFLNRVTGAALLNPAIYEEVEADRAATMQAMAVVALSSLAAGVGALGLASARITALAGISLLAFAVWVIWAVLTLQIGARIFPSPRTQADIGQLLRTIGFATAPGILRIAGIIPGTTTIVFAVTAIWMLMAMIVAIRQALDYTSTARAFARVRTSAGRSRSASRSASACSGRRRCIERNLTMACTWESIKGDVTRLPRSSRRSFTKAMCGASSSNTTAGRSQNFRSPPGSSAR